MSIRYFFKFEIKTETFWIRKTEISINNNIFQHDKVLNVSFSRENIK